MIPVGQNVLTLDDFSDIIFKKQLHYHPLL